MTAEDKKALAEVKGRVAVAEWAMSNNSPDEAILELAAAVSILGTQLIKLYDLLAARTTGVS